MVTYTIADAYATDLYQGDPVKSTGTGTNVQIGTAGGTILGIFWGCEYVDSTGAHKFSKRWTASTSVLSGTTPRAYVYDDPNIIFRAQASGSVVEADVRLHADLASGTGDASTQYSAWEIGASSGSEAQIVLLNLSTIPQGNAYGANAVMDFKILEHELIGAGTEV
jgi:hypothetical protein